VADRLDQPAVDDGQAVERRDRAWAASNRRHHRVIPLGRFGAGEEIRTLDPNLGNFETTIRQSGLWLEILL
jgi:hypothetical protein